MLLAIKLVFFKEIKEVWRDHRSLLVALVISIFMPLSLLGSLHFVSAQQNEAETLEFSIVGSENEPALVSFLNSKGIKTTNKVDAKNVQLTIPADYKPLLAKGFLPALTITADFSKHPDAIRMLEESLREYGSGIAAGRLVARGISPIILQPYQVHIVDVGEESLITRYMAPSIIFMFLIIPIYILMPAAIDCTAGERERHGLFPLLLLPIPAISITAGKFLMLVVSGMGGLAVSVIVGFISYSNFSPEGLSFGFDMSVVNGLLFLLVSLPTVMFLAALTMGFASFAKTFKEGQSYVGMGSLVPVLCMGTGFLLEETWRPYLPFWAEMKVLSALLTGAPVILAPWLMAACGYFTIVTLCVLWVNRSTRRHAIESQ
ncbi:MAG: ABC transporter permease subunit [Kordiimonadaceae bacterium]|nr:ABC transporter permease subunit [Kordiimonadaceae bacterium]